MTILEEVPAELASLAANLEGEPIPSGFALSRARLRVKVTLAGPGKLRLRVERSDLVVAPVPAGNQATPYRAADRPGPILLAALEPVELRLRPQQDSAAGDDFDALVETQGKLSADELQRLLSAEVRRRALQLLREGFDPIVLLCDGPAIETGRSIEEGLAVDGTAVKDALDALVALAEALPQVAPARGGTNVSERRFPWWLFKGLVLILGVMMIVGFWLWSFINPLATFLGVLVGTAISLTLGPIIVMQRMRAGGTAGAAFATWGWLAIGLPIALQAAILWVNCGLDSSPVQEWRAPVLRITRVQKKKSVEHEAVLQSRKQGERPLKLTIRAGMYSQLNKIAEKDRAVVLDLRKGALGFEWYTTVEIAP